MAIDNSNKKKAEQLGQPFGTASHKLRKMLLFSLVCATNQNNCFRCKEEIRKIEDFSIEHIVPWQNSEDPKGLFFDLANISYSHRRCNSAAVRPHNKKYFSKEEKREAGKVWDKTYRDKTYTPERRKAQYLRTGK